MSLAALLYCITPSWKLLDLPNKLFKQRFHVNMIVGSLSVDQKANVWFQRSFFPTFTYVIRRKFIFLGTYFSIGIWNPHLACVPKALFNSNLISNGRKLVIGRAYKNLITWCSLSLDKTTSCKRKIENFKLKYFHKMI